MVNEFTEKLILIIRMYNFDIQAKYLSGRCNVIADAASRLHEDGQLSRLYDILTSYNYIPFTVDELLRHVLFAFYSSRWYKSVFDLEIAVRRLKDKGWADFTSGTYRTHMKTYIHFCEEYELQPVPCDQINSRILYCIVGVLVAQ